MLLAQYLKENNIDQIENDLDFCLAEHEAIAEYFQMYEVSKEDINEAEARGYDSSYLIV